MEFPTLVTLLIYGALAGQMERVPQENDNICANHFLKKLAFGPVSHPFRKSLKFFVICIFFRFFIGRSGGCMHSYSKHVLLRHLE